MSTDYQGLAKQLVARAKKKGAQQAEVYMEIGRESSVRVRDGQIEDLTQATSKGAGVRVFVKNRLGFAWTSDFTPDALNATVDRAVELAAASAPNPLNGLPGKKQLGKPADVGELFDEAVASLDPEWKIKSALEMEKAGKAFDPRIKTFESVGAGDYVTEVHLASSEGALGTYRGTYVYLSASAVASQGDQLQVGDWFDYKRFLNELKAPELVAQEAAQRAVRMLGASKVKTQAVPVVFDPMMAASFVGSIGAAANGDAVYKKSSFLASKLNESIAPDGFTIVDDGLLARGLGTSPFDGEGVPTRKTGIVERGVLKAFLYDTFTARKAKAETTGNAARGYRSLPSIGSNNLYLEAGTRDPKELVREVKNGFYVTKMLGHGLNLVTGEYSRGANGLWIENGELTRPVQEVTVAGSLLGMLKSIDGIGSDLTFRGSTGAPTIRFAELTVSGE
ncbi:MAG: TldD/PmbA family protein [Myxococcaceae bacterium]|nr:TldD/PmbA family protein [Myxococcaceae bacterium]